MNNDTENEAKTPSSEQKSEIPSDPADNPIKSESSENTQDDKTEHTKDLSVDSKETYPKPEIIKDASAEKKLRSEAHKTLKEAKKLFKRAAKKLSDDRQKEVQKAIDELDSALKDNKLSCSASLENLKKVVEKRIAFARKSSTQEIVESLLIALALALVLRTFLVEPFKIPTRSMVPTLLEGDQLFVTKLSYGIRLPFANNYIVKFSEPARGDVVVFAFPREDAAKYLAKTNSGCLAAESLSEQKDYIKRIIGVAGDKVEVIDQKVYVNGELIPQQPFYERNVLDYMFLTDRRHEAWNTERHGGHTYTTITHELPSANFGPIIVDPDHVFVMGDNRDNSADSRCWGQVPVGNIKGRAQIRWWSGGSKGPRWERMLTKID